MNYVLSFSGGVLFSAISALFVLTLSLFLPPIADVSPSPHSVYLQRRKENPKKNEIDHEYIKKNSWETVAKDWEKALLTEPIRHMNFKNLEEYKQEYKGAKVFSPPNFAENGQPIMLSRFKVIEDAFKALKVKSSFDVGMADGALCHILARDLNIQADGVEIDPKCVEFAKKYAKENNLTCEFWQGTFEEFEPKRKYDAITLCEVLEHVIDPKAFLEKANKMAKYVVITTPNKEGVFGERNRDLHHLRTFTMGELTEFIGKKKIVFSDKLDYQDILFLVYENG